nr:DUF3850 domain-containing protein [uncultured Pseudomonas sp.]
MSKQHVLKIHKAPLEALLSGAKTCEIRFNDRGFQVGDTVRLMEVNPETGNWTGATDHVRTISHIQTGYGLPDGMCVLSYAQAGMELVGYANFDRLDNMLDDRTATVFPDRSSYAGTPVYRPRAALATQPAAGEPAGWECFDGRYASLSYEREGDPERAVPLFRAAPPAAAHGDEAVLWELLEELRTATDRQALPGEFIRVMWEAGCDWINARAAMRAQGDGEVQ